ncbi:MAG: hypothetical protein ACYC1M_09375 [Armatimonadota bacterium]
MRHRLALVISLLCLSAGVLSAASAVRDIYPDTWVGTDALGRTMPTQEITGPLKRDQRRDVGIFYVTWHTDGFKGLPSPYTGDVTEIYRKDPSARLDGNNPLWQHGMYHWGKPEMGYFLSQDEYVIRKDMSMLADAGVDVVILDVTNAVRYWEEWEVLLPVMQKMKNEGNKVPRFCFWVFNGDAIRVVQELYDRIYKDSRFKDLWYYWDGKPLLLYNASPATDATGSVPVNKNLYYDSKAKSDPTNPHFGDPKYTTEILTDYPSEIKSFFTTRNMWWGYYEWAGKRFVGTEGNWSLGYDLGDKAVQKMNPVDLAATWKGKREEVAVAPGQHSHTLIGKSWSREQGEPELNEYDLPTKAFVPWLGKTVKNPEGYGIYFQQRFDEALAADPQFMYINDWNEWTAGKWKWENGFMRRPISNFVFIDQYNAEFNRTIQPMEGGYTDNYYMQMTQNIRRYKGARPIPVNRGINPIRINGRFDDWSAVKVEYRDTIADVFHRDHPGYGEPNITNNSGRNDIITSKLAVDDQNLYFYAQTSKPLSPHSDPNWMLLLIDADQNPNTGWYGYDYLINKQVLGDDVTTICKYQPGQPEPWQVVGELKYRAKGAKTELAVPRALLGMKGSSFTFDFKWADNPADLKDPISLCLNGDTAPNRRFNYRGVWKR